jgi:D-glycero-beta-D-manno-heptose 1-phosphate adenylyltransferase
MDHVEIIESKIFTWPQIAKQCAVWRFLGKKIIFTNGCFDILHLGHIEYLSRASDLGGVLILGLNTDSSVRKIKGDNRPVNNEKARAMALASLFFVDAVVLFAEETPYELIRLIQPDILVKGEDYEIDRIVGADIVRARGGEIKTIELTKGYSTSGIISKIKDSSDT